MKTTNPLAALFAKSPFGPMQEHMRTVEQAVAELLPLIEALAAEDMEAVAAHRDEVFRLENEADEIKNDIRAHLPKSLLLPVARRDLLELLSSQDAVADAAQDAAGLLGMGKLKVLPVFQAELLELTTEVISVTGKCREVICRLDELLELGFRGRGAEQVMVLIDDLSAAESVTDRQAIALVSLLLDNESLMGPLSVVFWYNLIGMLAGVADEAENVGDRLRLLLAH